MKTVCSTAMPFAREAFGSLGAVTVLEGRSISAFDVQHADLLAIRSTTKVNRALLEGSRVKFVGTATIGTDHIDINYLQDNGIQWCHSPGCNARSVSEYVTAALLCLAERNGFTLEDKTIGVVGAGNVGGRVIEKALALGMRVLVNDPPRWRVEGDNVSIQTDSGTIETPLQFVALARVLEEADIITLHVPLTREGSDRTHHMADKAFFHSVRPGCVFINSARGAVADTDALLQAMEDGRVAHAVIDTWEGEPEYRSDLLRRVDLGTPHIAGYSFDGKVKGTTMVYQAACRFLGVAPTWTPDEHLPRPDVPLLMIDAGGRVDQKTLWDVVRPVYDITADDRRLRETLDMEAGARTGAFDRLRRHYPIRREFPFTKVNLNAATESLRHRIAGLGFAL